MVNQSAYSITGSLQPLILRQMMGDFTDANGQWARFLWTVMQVQPAPYPHDAIPFDVSGLLKGIYKRLRNLPPITYTLSSQAKKLYSNWYDELDRLKMAESRQGLRAIYSKMKGDTGVLALLLHCFNGCVVEGSTPALEVDEAIMAAAIKLSKYHIGQVKLIHSEGDVANGDVAAIHAKIIQLSERKGWLKAADVRDIDRQTKKQFSADDIRRHFQELEVSGFGQTKGQRTKLMWSIYGDTPPYGSPPPSGKTQDSFEQLRTNSGQKSPNSGQTQDSLEIAESITNISVKQLVTQTQDTQDSFLASAAPSLNPLSTENEIKATDLNFCVLSCPELDDESENQETVGISEDAQTQDNCPEFVLSCPEFDGTSDAIAPDPWEDDLEAAEVSLESETPQLLQQGTVETVPTALEEGYRVINADSDGWGELVCEEEAIAKRCCEAQIAPIIAPQDAPAAAICSVATSKAVPLPQPRQLPPVGTRIEPLNGTYSGLVCIVQSLKGNMIWASPENNPKKPEYGYLAGEYKILPATFAPAATIEESPEVKEHTAVAVIPQDSTAKPTTEVVTVVADEWTKGDCVVVDATDLPPSLQAYDGRQGVVTKVKESSAQCLVDFGGDEFTHIPFRGLKRG